MCHWLRFQLLPLEVIVALELFKRFWHRYNFFEAQCCIIDGLMLVSDIPQRIGNNLQYLIHRSVKYGRELGDVSNSNQRGGFDATIDIFYGLSKKTPVLVSLLQGTYSRAVQFLSQCSLKKLVHTNVQLTVQTASSYRIKNQQEKFTMSTLHTMICTL